MDERFKLEKMNISNRLQDVENELKNLTKMMDERKEALDNLYRTLSADVEKLNKIIIGNGQVGLSETVRCLWNDKKNRNIHFMMIWTAIVTALVSSFVKITLK